MQSPRSRITFFRPRTLSLARTTCPTVFMIVYTLKYLCGCQYNFDRLEDSDLRANRGHIICKERGSHSTGFASSTRHNPKPNRTLDVSDRLSNRNAQRRGDLPVKTADWVT